ncbi:MAG: helicase-exonuclease AddAB subunit AddA [Christensenellales bacterium]|jgi:ATP-dependent helicase/nuclease subunit A
MFELNAAQKEAISHRGGDILVSAGAGSGKTFVLKERILSLVEEGVLLEDMLVVTFTNAAAAEMRQRILDGLMHRDSPSVQEQIRSSAADNICTVHKFCMEVLRKHFALIGLDPDFKVAQEDICAELKQEALDELFESLYGQGDEEFLAFAAYFDDDDDSMMELVEQSYRFSRSHSDPEGFLRSAMAKYGDGGAVFIRELTEQAMQQAHQARQFLGRARDLAKNAGLAKPLEVLTLEDAELEQFMQKAREDYGQAANYLLKAGAQLRFPSKGVDEAVKEQIKSERDRAKKIVRGLVESPLNRSRVQMDEEMAVIGAMVGQVVRVSGLFAQRYAQKKAKRRLLDFSDLEHYAIAALDKGAAQEYVEKFQYIFVDEYQDITQVQEELLSRISRSNRFMVGDVKQSIYRFRMGDPGLFLGKYEDYGRGAGKRIDLNENYRCSRVVVDFVNRLFGGVMSRSVGEVEYSRQPLVFGSGQEGGEAQIMVVPREDSGDEAAVLEARACAARIRELRKEGYEYGDIAVLMRAVRGFGDLFAQTLSAQGIPVFADFGGGYLAAPEVELALNFLSLADNRRQDVPLIAVMRSFLGGFDEEELAQIRLGYPDGEYFDALCLAAEQQTELGEKARTFRALLDRFRQMAQVYNVEELTARLFFETPFYDYVQALPDGVQRKANLDLLLERARDFEQSSFKGLYLFLRYIRRLQKRGQDLDAAAGRGENDDAVRITTIHKSKGLEFPAVIVARMGKGINLIEGKKPWIFHKELGLALRYVDPSLRVRRQSAAYAALVARLNRELLSEEMRMLYVAMTRAEKSLTLLGCLKETGLLQEAGAAPSPQQARSYFDWVGYVFAGQWDVREYTAWDKEEEGRFRQMDGSGQYGEYVRQRMAYRYEQGRPLPSKVAASKVAAALEMGELAAALPIKELKVPLFRMREEMSAARRGSIWHLLMQLQDLRDTSPQSVGRTLEGMVDKELIFPEEKAAVSPKMVSAFFDSPLGRRMKASPRVLRELPFNMAVSQQELLGEGGGELLVQGVVDCCFEEAGRYVLVDYKTDAVRGDSRAWAMKHEMQIELYRKALSFAGMDVGECWIFFFSTQEAVRMWPKEKD